MTSTGTEGGTAALTPSLETRRLHLRIMTNEDHAPLYRLSSDPEVTFQWRFRGTTPSYDEFLRQLNPGVLCQFVVSPLGSQELLGLVAAYDADFRHRFCRAAVVMHPRLHRRGLGLEAFLGLARYVYYGWDFRMIIMDTVGIAFATFASGEQAGYFTVEGRVKDQFFYGGRYWDGISITHRREQFDTVMAGPMSRLVTPGRRVARPTRPTPVPQKRR
jgi:RimJ/RimL family protein N-acetyltransferase